MGQTRELVETLATAIGDTVRDPAFLRRTEGLTLDEFQTALEKEMAKRKIKACIIYLKAAPAGAPNDILARWQPHAGGDHRELWFSRENPTPA